jgi:hypothetical protein
VSSGKKWKKEWRVVIVEIDVLYMCEKERRRGLCRL